MRFLISVIDDSTGSATPTEMTAVDAFNQRLMADGHWVFADGLTAPHAAAVIDNRSNAVVFADGPLHSAREYLSGCWIITAPNIETARQLAAEASKCCNRKVELRPFLGH
ncbi:MAG: YciI family protein [Actinomycetota bacterium]|nr:YciI family protein [Actinomycetota bacterium]